MRSSVCCFTSSVKLQGEGCGAGTAARVGSRPRGGWVLEQSKGERHSRVPKPLTSGQSKRNLEGKLFQVCPEKPTSEAAGDQPPLVKRWSGICIICDSVAYELMCLNEWPSPPPPTSPPRSFFLSFKFGREKWNYLQRFSEPVLSFFKKALI